MILTSLFLFLEPLFCNQLEDGWRGIKPLKSDKARVETILGKPTRVDEDGYHYYTSDEVFI